MSGRSPGVRKWQLTPVLLPVEFYGQRSLAGPWVPEESGTTEHTAPPPLCTRKRRVNKLLEILINGEGYNLAPPNNQTPVYLFFTW